MMCDARIRVPHDAAAIGAVSSKHGAVDPWPPTPNRVSLIAV
jgi:hypothetical protein